MLSVLKISHKSGAISSSENLVPWGLHYQIAPTAEKERIRVHKRLELYTKQKHDNRRNSVTYIF